MKKSVGFLVVLSVMIIMFFSACDKVKPPYKESESGTDDTSTVRKFLLEEFTGHECPNCPQGTAVAEQLQALYGSRLILLSIHAGNVADPGLGEFALNLESSTGNDINTFFGVIANPTGMVSRTGWTTSQNLAVLDKDSWGPRIESLKNLSPLVSVEIANTYDTITRTLNSSIECDALQSLTGTYKIAAYLAEDSIIGAQETENDPNYPDNIIHNYVFKNVLRGALNSTWGDTLTSGNTANNAQLQKSYSMVLNSAWKAKHCYVIAFVYDASDYEIVQVEEKKVQ